MWLDLGHDPYQRPVILPLIAKTNSIFAGQIQLPASALESASKQTIDSGGVSRQNMLTLLEGLPAPTLPGRSTQ